ncbi:MAG: ABC transporter ATP-binding protein [Chloroflexota bacterium]|nr:ABC transporter ATP-binding protein [Chloroflexota bacterium]
MNAPAALGRVGWGLRALRGLPAVLRLYGRGLALPISSAPLAGGAYLVLLAILSLLPVLQVWLSKLLLDAIAAGTTGDQGAVGDAVTLAVIYALTLVVPAGLRPVQAALSSWLQDRSVVEVDRRLMQAGASLVDLYRIERPAFHDEVTMARRGSMLAAVVLGMLHQIVGTLLTLVGLLILLGQLHPLLPLALVVVSLPHLFAELRVGILQHQALQDQSRPAREMDYCARVTTEPAAAKEVRVFGLGDFFWQRFRERFAVALAEVNRIRLAGLRFSTVFSGLYALALAGGFWYVVAQAGAGQLTLGDIVLYLGAVQQVQGLTYYFMRGLAFQHELWLHLRTIFGFLDSTGPAITLAPPGQGRPAPPTFHTGLELRQVGFRYPESTRTVLADVSAMLPAGQVTALVGANGAGKSTLVKLLTRMYDPVTGAILLDGVPLPEYDLAALRQRIAVVHQDFAQFSLTLHENIAVGAYAAGVPAGHVEQAARWAGADEIAAKLPKGYDTPLTRQFEGGVELSGGEWQKVALARGFVRDAALVILDEPTAALDAEAEYRLFAQFRELVVGKTALLISHRFSTVRMADHIIVLEEGRAIEAGSHDELVAQGGRYATLYEMQAGRYR